MSNGWEGAAGNAREFPFPDAVEFRRAQRGQSSNVAVRLAACSMDVGTQRVSPPPPRVVDFGRAQRDQNSDVFVPWHVERARGSRT